LKRVYREKLRFSPRAERTERYNRYYNIYRRIYKPLMGIFDEIYRLAEETE